MRKGEMLFRELENIDMKYLEEGYTKMKDKKKYKIGIAAALLALFIALPNASPAFAKTLAELPLLGVLFEVVTIIDIEEKNEMNEVDISIPQIDNNTNSSSVERVNEMIQIYTERLIQQFYEDSNESPGSLNLNYEIVTNSEKWFSIAINSVEIQASGYERKHYYNINKTTGEYMVFSDLFNDFSKSKALINENIISQMKVEMANEDLMYFSKEEDGSGFESVLENQNYYFNENDELVISFDEYEVAPGYMGIVEFTIPYEFIN